MRPSHIVRSFLEDTDTTNTLGNLVRVMHRQSFAYALLILLLPTALPIPTGGVTNILEVIALILSFQYMLGKTTVTLPKKIMNYELRWASKPVVVASLTRFIEKIESFAVTRIPQFLRNTFVQRVTGMFLIMFCLGAIAAPWFTGLDTLPSLGVVLISLSLIFEDSLLWFVSLLCGFIGCILIVLVYIYGIGIIGDLWNSGASWLQTLR